MSDPVGVFVSIALLAGIALGAPFAGIAAIRFWFRVLSAGAGWRR